MTEHKERLVEQRLGAADGFAVPVVLFALLVMASLAAAGLMTAGNERRAARGTRDAAAAFYAAEAGLQAVRASWPDSIADALAPGDSADLGWTTREDGSSYRAVLHRYDAGDQAMLELTVEGRGSGPAGGQRLLRLFATSNQRSLGACCDAVATVDGTVDLTHYGTELDGHDYAPAGWVTGGVCEEPDDDVIGLKIRDSSQFRTDGRARLDGVPPLEQDTTINEQTFSQFGPNLTWEQLKNLADHELGNWGSGREQEYRPRPSYNADGSCNTDDPRNWGSSNPSDPCFDHWPIVLLKGDVAIQNGYGHALVILDWNEGQSIGTELDIEFRMRFDGIILGKGCIEIQGGSRMYGAVFADGNYFNSNLCQGDRVLDLNADSEGGNAPGDLLWSRCVVDQVLARTGVEPYTVASGYGVLSPRGFSDAIR